MLSADNKVRGRLLGGEVALESGLPCLVTAIDQNLPMRL